MAVHFAKGCACLRALRTFVSKSRKTHCVVPVYISPPMLAASRRANLGITLLSGKTDAVYYTSRAAGKLVPFVAQGNPSEHVWIRRRITLRGGLLFVAGELSTKPN